LKRKVIKRINFKELSSEVDVIG